MISEDLLEITLKGLLHEVMVKLIECAIISENCNQTISQGIVNEVR